MWRVAWCVLTMQSKSLVRRRVHKEEPCRPPLEICTRVVRTVGCACGENILVPRHWCLQVTCPAWIRPSVQVHATTIQFAFVNGGTPIAKEVGVVHVNAYTVVTNGVRLRVKTMDTIAPRRGVCLVHPRTERLADQSPRTKLSEFVEWARIFCQSQDHTKKSLCAFQFKGVQLKSIAVGVSETRHVERRFVTKKGVCEAHGGSLVRAEKYFCERKKRPDKRNDTF